MLRFEEVALALEDVEKLRGRIEMAERLAELLRKANVDEIKNLTYFLQGTLGPSYLAKELGIAERLSIQAIAEACGYHVKEVERIFMEKGDLGLVVMEVIKKKRQISLFSKPLTFLEVFTIFNRIADCAGERSVKLKKKLLAELLNNAGTIEAKFIMRFALGQLRLGAGTSTIIEAMAIAKTGDRSNKDIIERAYNLCSDLGLVAEMLWAHGLEGLSKVSVQPLIPLRPALAERLPNAKEIFAKLGKCAVEFKFDGFRMQIHKKGDRVIIFSRKLEDITHMFPDVVEAVKGLKNESLIFEGEALAYDAREDQFYSFQETMHRRRKYGIDKASKQYPLHVYVFDVLFVDGKALVDEPYIKRREILESLFPFKVLKKSKMWIAENWQEIDKIFQEAIKKKLEGVMVKDLNAPYTAGARKFAWIKLKRSYGTSVDTIDAVVLGYYKGKGARATFEFGGFLVGVWNKEKGVIQTIAKVGSGFSEEEMMEWKERLDKIKRLAKPSIVESNLEPDVWVEPTFVIEVAFDEITQSPTHTCAWKDGRGLALRFPRFVRIRDDKNVEDATTTDEIEEMFSFQHSSSSK